MAKITLKNAQSNAQRIVLKCLDRLQCNKTWKGEYVLIQCPFHSDDDTPSCKINLAESDYAPVGFVYCWGCGHKGPWNATMAPKFGFPELAKGDSKLEYARLRDTEEMRRKLLDIEEFRTLDQHLTNDRIMSIKYPDRMRWRGIDETLMKQLGARMFLDRKDQTRLLALPVVMDDDCVGYIKARVQKKKGDISYINQEGEWVKKQALFPLDIAVQLAKKKRHRTVVLCEGPRDALKLIQQGIPAVAILGAKNWGKAKRDLLESTYFKRVVICMDSDGPGIDAAKKVRKSLYGHMRYTDFTPMLVKHAKKVKKEIDPGNMDRSLVKKLRTVVEA